MIHDLVNRVRITLFESSEGSWRGFGGTYPFQRASYRRLRLSKGGVGWLGSIVWGVYAVLLEFDASYNSMETLLRTGNNWLVS